MDLGLFGEMLVIVTWRPRVARAIACVAMTYLKADPAFSVAYARSDLN